MPSTTFTDLASVSRADLYTFILFLVTYLVFAPLLPTLKQKCYVISVLNSGVMCALSVWAVWEWAVGMGWLTWAGYAVDLDAAGRVLGVDVAGNLQAMTRVMTLQDLARASTAFFRVYLFADLAIGSIAYPKNIGVLTGWVHHVSYIALTTYLLHTQYTPIFLLSMVLEIPTLHLGLSTLRPKVFRHDLTFLILFGATRVAFHAYTIYCLFAPASLGGVRTLPELAGSFTPAILNSLAMPLHVMWLHAGVVGYIKRRRMGTLGRAGKSKKVSALAEAEDLEVRAKRSAAAEGGVEALVEAAGVDILPSTAALPVPASSLLSPDEAPGLSSGASTPEDEHLVVTPGYTPSSAANTAFTSYFMPKNGARPRLLDLPSQLNIQLPDLHLPEQVKVKREELRVQMAGALNAWRERRNTWTGTRQEEVDEVEDSGRMPGGMAVAAY